MARRVLFCVLLAGMLAIVLWRMNSTTSVVGPREVSELTRPDFELFRFSDEEKSILQKLIQYDGQRPESLVNSAVVILTDESGDLDSRPKQYHPIYEINRRDVAALFGSPDQVFTNKQRQECAIFNIAAADAITDSVSLYIEYEDNHVFRIFLNRTL